MARVERYIQAIPEDVFEVLSDGWSYSNWVVGTSHMRAVGDQWPNVGSKLFHSSGVWPAALRDETEVEEVVTNERLVMMARGRPFGEARVKVHLRLRGTGTHVVLIEEPVSGPGAWVDNPVSEMLLRRRNIEALARLAAIAERRTTPQD
jgi:uncharacterized protein YndB with AHSA1/START domain